METVTQNMVGFLGAGAAWVVKFFLAILILILGWFISKIVARIVRQILITEDFDQRLGRMLGLDALTEAGDRPKRRLASVVETVVYYILLLIVVIIALEVLGDQAIRSVLQENILGKLTLAVPKILKATLVLVGGWIVALVAKFLVMKGMRKLELGERLDKALAVEEGAEKREKRDVTESFGNFVFYFIIMFSLLAFLESLDLQALVDPLKGMFTKVFTYVPNLLSAGVVLVLGYFLARLAERITTNFALAAGVNRFVEGMRFETVLKSLNIARILGTMVFLVIMVPVLGVTFNILDLPVITGAFGTMMNGVAASVPGILAAFILMIFGLIAGRYLGDFVAQILQDVGFDVLLSRLGLERLEGKADDAGRPTYSLSRVGGNIIMAVVVLVFLMEGFRLMHLPLIADAVDRLILYLPNVLVAFVVLGLGFYLARVVGEMAQRGFASDRSFEGDIVGLVIRYAIIVFAFFMAFDQLKIAHSIVVNAFTILLGTVGLGLALAFGLGAKDHAGEYIESLKKRKPSKRKES